MKKNVHSVLFFIALLFCLVIQPHSAYAARSQAAASVEPKAVYPHFEHIGPEAGLTQRRISSMVQDRKGRLWIGTKDGGLVRYDGYGFKTFSYDPNDSTSLSSNSVQTIFLDSRGRLWIGAKNTLNLFNPGRNNFSHIHLLVKPEEAARPMTVSAICEDSTGVLWAGSALGLFQIDVSAWQKKFSPDQNAAAHINADIHLFLPVPENPASPLNNITSLLLGKNGDVWVGTAGGIGRFSPHSISADSLDFTAVAPRAGEAAFQKSDIVRSLSQNDDGAIWAAFETKLMRIDPATKNNRRRTYTLAADYVKSLSPPSLDRDELFWFGNPRQGLYFFDAEAEHFYTVAFDEADPQSLAHQGIAAIVESESGIVFIGTVWGGLYKYDPFARFTNYHPALRRVYAGDPNSIRFVYQDSRGDLWIAAKDVYRCDRRTGKVLQVFSEHDFPPRWSYKNKILEDRNGDIWIGAEGEGLYKYDHRSGKMLHYDLFRHKNSEALSVVKVSVTALCQDKDGAIWAGALQAFSESDVQKTVLYKINGRSHDIRVFDVMAWQHVFQEQEEQFIYQIYQAPTGELWLATGFGLVRFDPQTGETKACNNNLVAHKGTKKSRIKSLCPDPNLPQRYLWLGEVNGGVSRFDLTDAAFLNFTIKDGLSSNHISSILPDKEGNLWLATDNGISKVALDKESVPVSFHNYNRSDGLSGDNFSYYYGHNAAATDDGEIIFSAQRGFDIFLPEKIKDNAHPPMLFISDVQINYQRIALGAPRSPLTMPIEQTRKLVLHPEQNTLAFELTAIDFRAPRKNLYAFMMQGLDHDWIQNGSNRIVQFTDLKPGKYTFRARAANSDGAWSEKSVSLAVIILPPWFQRWWAIIVYVAAFLGVSYLVIHFLVHRQKLRYELELQKLEAEKLHEMDSLKSDFFANVSHEFRTPLTLIIGPLDKLLSKRQSSENKKTLTLIRRNASHLLELISELLDFSKLEARRMRLKATPGNIVRYAKKLTMSFESAALQKNIALKFQAAAEEMICYYDAYKIQKVFYNLLSNAIKFTPQGGEVAVSLSVCSGMQEAHCNRKQGCVRISVRDSGVGIPREELPHIFDRYYQGNQREPGSVLGSGIGLALVKELIELHNGYFCVDSEVGLGTTFTFNLPLGDSHLKREQIMQTNAAGDENLPAMPEGVIDRKEVVASAIPDADDSIILIIEDNSDVREFIRDGLSAHYRVLEAENGRTGISLAVDAIPDLIISDVMMPEQNGYEVCLALKNNENTSHIPIILLTAKADLDDKIEGLATGADDYLLKPFDERELLVRVDNLIQSRKKLRKKFGSARGLKPSDVAATPIDEQFLQRALKIVEDNMQDENFGVQVFSLRIAMSRTQLHRKLKALTNQSANEFIQSIRLNRAAALLKKKSGTIAEIAFEVGFVDSAYFSRAFKKQFGKTPSSFVN